jgi:hypothetical protein
LPSPTPAQRSPIRSARRKAPRRAGDGAGRRARGSRRAAGRPRSQLAWADAR